MAGIQSLGVGSGTLTTDLVTDIVAAERKASDLRLEAKTARVEAKISAYSELRTVLSDVQSSLSSLAKSSTIQKTTATSSNSSVLTATTSAAAEPGTYRIEVDEVAKSHSLASQVYSAVDDTVGTGSLTFKLGAIEFDDSGQYDSFTQTDTNIEQTIEITSENNTLGGIRDAINNADFDVNATIVYDGTGYRLLLSSENSGAQNSMEITVEGDSGLQSLAYNAAQNDASLHMEQTQPGTDASVRVNGLAVSSQSNQLSEVIKGVTLNLADTSESAISLTVNRDVSSIADQMEGFVEQYNAYKTLYDELNSYNETESIGGILMGDSLLRSIHSQIRSGLTDIIDGFSQNTYTSLVDIGLSTDQFNGFKLSFNRTAFESAMQIDALSVNALMATATEASDAQVNVITPGADTKPGRYPVNITQVATQGHYQGLRTDALDFSSEVVISDINDKITFVIDDKTATVYLDQGRYSQGDELALMIQNSVNKAFNGQSVTVDFDATEQSFRITSSKFGDGSNVSISATDALVGQTLGLVVPGVGQAAGSYFTSLSDQSFSAATSPANLAVSQDAGFDFSTHGVSFDLTLSGTSADGTHSIRLYENWSSILDTDGNVVTERNRDDVLTYIQSELNDAGLAGVVNASFNSSDRLVFSTIPQAGTQSIVLDNIALDTSLDYLGLEDTAGNSGLTIDADTRFVLNYTNRYGSVTSSNIVITPGLYQTSDELAEEIQAQINADPTILANSQGAMTESGSRDLSGVIDFNNDAAQLVFKLNGIEHTVNVTANGVDTVDSIQSSIDSVVGAGQVIASLEGNGLVLTTVGTGRSETLEVVSSGKGATTDSGSVDLSTGIDFSAAPAGFTLAVDGLDINVLVETDATLGTNDAQSNLQAIQNALDTALAAAEGGGAFSAGDVVAKLDDSQHLYFETVAKNGEPTETMFGADASIQLTSADANATALLGISSGPVRLNGFDGFGLDQGVYEGFDSVAAVTYEQDDAGDGRFVIKFDNETRITLADLSLTAITQLGLSEGNDTSSMRAEGVDVEGTINGVSARGSGQYLTASDGNSAATNGYLLGGVGWDFSAAAVIDDSNNNLKVAIDGVESGTITLNNGAYSTGASLADVLQTQINLDSALRSAGKSVDVQYDEATGIFGIFSVSKGEGSSVAIRDIASSAIDIFGMTTSSPGVNGKDSEGTVDDASGMMIKVTGTRIGDRGTVSYVEGVMHQLNQFMDNLLNSSGLLTMREDRLSEEQSDIEAEVKALDERMESYEKSLVSKFLYNDSLISRLNTMSSFLTQQFKLMSSSSKDD